jgi:predicted cobalt transporter CbtA
MASLSTPRAAAKAAIAGMAVGLMAAFAVMPALAQQRTYFGADGRVSGRSVTAPNGATTIYGSDGRVSGRTSTSGNQTTIFDASGRNVGRVTKPQGERP